MEINAAAAWLNSTFGNLDVSVALAVHKLYDMAGGFFTPFFEVISFFGKGGICLIFSFTGACVFQENSPLRHRNVHRPCDRRSDHKLLPEDRYRAAAPVWIRTAYFISCGCWSVRMSRATRASPSGHTTAAFASMVPLFILGNKRWSWTALLFAFTMGIARIYLVVHYTSDVIGGLIVGTFAGIIAVIVAKKLPQKWYELDFYKSRSSQPPDSLSA